MNFIYFFFNMHSENDSENDSASSFFIRMFDITVSIFLQVKIKTLNINNFFLNNDIVMKFSTRVS